MITSIHLQNFQNHESLTLCLAQVTTLVGPNGCGKSAIVRALKWVCLGEWDGEANSHITWDKDSSVVEIKCGKHTITREKGKNVNIYKVDEEVYQAGKGVPVCVQRVLKTSLDNFQDQHEGAFWLSFSPGDAAKALNEIFHLSQIDETHSNIGKELRQARMEEKVTKDRLLSAREIRDSLIWVKQADKDLKEIEALEQKAICIRHDINKKQEKLREVRQLEDQQKRLESLISLNEPLIELGEKILAIRKKKEVLEKMVQMEKEVCQLTKLLTQKQNQLDKLLKGKCPLCLRE